MKVLNNEITLREEPALFMSIIKNTGSDRVALATGAAALPIRRSQFVAHCVTN